MTVLALLITLAVVVASVVLTRGVTAIRRSAAGAGGGAVQDVMEAAFLNGGPSRTVDTALAAMHQDGRLAIGGPGIVSARSTVTRDPVERAVLHELAAAPNGALHTLRHAVMRNSAVQEVGDSLAFRGLMVPPHAGHNWRTRSHILTLACVLGFPAAVVVSFVEDSGIPFVVKILPALILGIASGAGNASRAAARVTPAGRAAAAAYRIAHAYRTDAGHLVALGGLRALPDPDLYAQLQAAARQTPRSRTTRAGTTSSTSDSSMYAAAGVVVWCASSGPGGSSCGSSGDSGSGYDSGSGSGGSSCSGSSGSSCSSSSGSSCGGGSSCSSSS
ncbi:TIGR04222 domain-containing membrane protein [Streptomyces spiramyceticus]|uniref:TIGR04222 domain-containing membrane protein n=1 Tax=Streptomyces spiramyceticus TaxID=299717 RepID=UPI00237C0ACD|nr:TIGR04222 domain-containing membrane protein [Streptomyces spiramyceticus]